MARNAFAALSLTDEREPKALAQQQSKRAKQRLERQLAPQDGACSPARPHRPQLGSSDPKQVPPASVVSWKHVAASAAAAAVAGGQSGWESEGQGWHESGWGSPPKPCDPGWAGRSPPEDGAAGADGCEEWIFGAPPPAPAPPPAAPAQRQGSPGQPPPPTPGSAAARPCERPAGAARLRPGPGRVALSEDEEGAALRLALLAARGTGGSCSEGGSEADEDADQLLAQQAAIWEEIQRQAAAARGTPLSGAAAAVAAPWGPSSAAAPAAAAAAASGWPSLRHASSGGTSGASRGGSYGSGDNDFELALALQREELAGAGGAPGAAWHSGGPTAAELLQLRGSFASPLSKGSNAAAAVAAAAAMLSPAKGPRTPGPQERWEGWEAPSCSDFPPLEPPQSPPPAAAKQHKAARSPGGWTAVPARRRTAGARSGGGGGGSSGAVAVVRVLRSGGGAPSPPPRGASSEAQEELHLGLLLDGLVPLCGGRGAPEEERTGGGGQLPDDDALARTLHLATLQQEAAGAGGNGGNGARGGCSQEAVLDMMARAARRHEAQKGAAGCVAGQQEEEAEGAVGSKAVYGREWHGLVRAMHAAGWQPVAGVKHPKFERVLPASGRRQVITLPCTPSDAIRGVKNTAADLVRLDREAQQHEAAALGAS